MTFFLRWSWLLGVALIAPIALPAGGAIDAIRSPEVRRRSELPSPFAGANCVLRSSPFKDAPSLKQLNNGTPLNVLRRWDGFGGETWLHVQSANSDAFGKLDGPRRGWINV